MGREAMAAAVVLFGLNIADALLARMNLNLGAVKLNPLAPPFEANLVGRGLLAIAIIIILYLIRREEWLWWLDFVVLAVIGWHLIGYWIFPLQSTPS